MLGYVTLMLEHPMRDAVLDALRLTLGGVWLLAAVRKLRTPALTRAAVRRLLGGPEWALPVVARALAPAELALAAALFSGWHERAAAIASAGLLVLFAVAIRRAGARGSLAGGGCGCFAAPTAPAAAATGRLVARNLLLAAVAVAVAGAGG